MNIIETSTMQVKIPFNEYLKEKEELALYKTQNELLKKSAKGLFVVLAEKPKDVNYTSYMDLSKFNFLDIRYEGVSEFMKGIDENLKHLTNERIKSLIELDRKRLEAIAKLEYRIKKYSDESAVIKANEGLIKKVVTLQDRNNQLEKEIKEKDDKLKNYSEIDLISMKNSFEESVMLRNAAEEKLKIISEERSKILDSYYKVCKSERMLAYELKKVNNRIVNKLINFICQKKKDKM